jgi:hypothetical protein
LTALDTERRGFPYRHPQQQDGQGRAVSGIARERSDFLRIEPEEWSLALEALDAGRPSRSAANSDDRFFYQPSAGGALLTTSATIASMAGSADRRCAVRSRADRNAFIRWASRNSYSWAQRLKRCPPL